MKTNNRIALALCSALLFAGAAEAHGSAVDTALGGALGGAAGAIIGQQVGGRNGAIIGGAVGAATGVYVVNDHGRRVERVEYVAAPVYVASRPVVYYAPRPVYYDPPGYYVAERARGHGYWKHHRHHSRDDWDDHEDRHENRHHWD